MQVDGAEVVKVHQQPPLKSTCSLTRHSDECLCFAVTSLFLFTQFLPDVLDELFRILMENDSNEYDAAVFSALVSQNIPKSLFFLSFLHEVFSFVKVKDIFVVFKKSK